ncbi:MAG: hypothetical protein M3Q08_10360 [Pseudomonadota bacterium]|nr:hypothetical protein [Pseudomonadota bacterium]
MQDATLKQFGVGALFKLGFIANVAIWSPISLIFGVAAMLGYNTVRWNGTRVHGVSGLALGLFIGLLSIAFGTLLFVSGAKIASMFSERLPSIPIKAAPESDQ